MPPTRTLPPQYAPAGTLDLSKNRGAYLAMNVVGLVLLVASVWLFTWIASVLRPDFAQEGIFLFALDGAGGFFQTLVKFILVLGAVLLLHEAVHGLFFWLFTGQRPVFGLRGAYAYAAAPGWYLPRGQYIIVGLAPLVLLSLAGIALLPFLPAAWVSPVLLFLVLNASGAVGDLFVVAWLLTRPRTVLASDSGDSISLYQPTSDQSSA